MPKSAKNGQNFPLLDKKNNPNFEFSHGYHYSYTLEDTQEKILGSFQTKLMTKIEVINQKPSKNWIFGKNGHFLAKKIPNFEFFYGYHYSHMLEDTWEKNLVSFQTKLITKIEVTNQKPSKTGFLAKMGIFWPKNPQF